jgi:hypothetical protein
MRVCKDLVVGVSGPDARTSVVCAVGTDENVDAEADRCENMVVGATNGQAASVTCAAAGCAGAQLACPGSAGVLPLQTGPFRMASAASDGQGCCRVSCEGTAPHDFYATCSEAAGASVTVHPGESEEFCRSTCLATAGCTAYEHNTVNCEIHTGAIGTSQTYTAAQSATGSTCKCFVKAPTAEVCPSADTQMQPGSNILTSREVARSVDHKMCIAGECQGGHYVCTAPTCPSGEKKG